ncbi:c-type cytochrome [Wohlfahrtiimonas chitiniclastica]|uniref:c-type cytochrome n=1 Tax=Wohlfahrtiimonas chitiniclastica TaxID=400946 RepID=UPI001BCB45DD|nr:cytochrome c [Wohlfahrtiimonas chitiniclastica]MBS7817067.1 cytochrome c [Wohlfahrtiimonas chitiniclastica]MBS7822729.1 cytochrome c [Wohlfahrtiimonas chitiniclastica]MBS7830544.1 cytochrome c [Wohlfahrtiimonas chitiniclastica]MBS7832628.1 cytochrome c [Wohlfahrtiimonas chitiniclastica]
MKKLALLAALSVATMSAGFAQDLEQAKKVRQSMFQVAAWEMGTLAGMAKSEIPFDAAKAEKAAKVMNAMAISLDEVFIPGSYAGSKVRSEINTKPELFQKDAANFVKESEAMITAASSEATLKAQLGKLGSTCKSCHDSFRAD